MTRRLWLGLIAGGLLAVPGVAVAVAASDGTSSSYSLSGDADASPLEIQMVAGSFAKGPLVDARYPHAQADVASGDQASAHGSILDPGNLVQTLPYEVGANCPPPQPFPQEPPPGGCPQFPSWPFGADADPAHPEVSGSVAGNQVGPLSFGVGEYDLSVSPEMAAATADGGRATLAAAAPLTVTSGEASASVAAQGSAVVSQVTERLQGIVIDGLLDIASVESVAKARTEAGSKGVGSGRLTVSGVTLAGQAASIDATGVHLIGQSATLPLDPAQQALQQLQQAGVSVKLFGPQATSQSGYGAYSGSAIEVTLASPQDGSGFTILLGPAAASAVAVPFQTFAAAPLTSVGGVTTTGLGAASLPGGLPPAAAPQPGGGSRVIRLLGLALTPRALIVALFALMEMSLLGAGAAVLWPAPPAPPEPTLRPL